MALRQTRRTISLNRSLYEQVKAYCEPRRIHMAQLLEGLLCAALDIPQQTQTPRSQMKPIELGPHALAARARRKGPTFHRLTRGEVQRVLSRITKPMPCALCTHEIVGPIAREPLGKDGAMVALCSGCAGEPPDLRVAAGGAR